MTARLVSFGEVVEINPKLALARGIEAPHIEMADLEAGTLSVAPRRRKPFSGGSRFQNGDVLFAKITPCLENGKTAGVIGLDRGVVGHGSTEFLVFRARPGLVDPAFLRYVSVESGFRAYAVANMNGSSGRQRVSADAIAKFKLDLPPLEEQRGIADVLDALDAKIVADNQAIRACENLVTQSYLDALGDDTTEINLASAVTVTKGVSYRSEDLRFGGGVLFSLKCFARDGSFAEDGLKPYDGPSKEAQRLAAGDIVVAQTDLTQDASVVGRALRVPDGLNDDPVVASLDASVIRPKNNRLPAAFLAAALRADAFRQHCRARSNGTTVLHMRSGTIESFDLPVPPPAAITAIDALASVAFALTDGLRSERRELVALRDALVADLLGGKRTVRVAP